jgi:hypothetical protein
VSLRRTLKPAALSTVVRLRVDAVADAGHGGDDRWIAEALAECRDGDAYGVGERICVVIPCPLQEVLRADDAAFGSDEDFEYGELLSRQRDVPIVAVDLPAERIQPQARDLSNRRRGVGASAAECSETEHQLAELERLGEVVVGSEPEP